MSVETQCTGSLSLVPNLRQVFAVSRSQQEFRHPAPLAFQFRSSLHLGYGKLESHKTGQTRTLSRLLKMDFLSFGQQGPVLPQLFPPGFFLIFVL